MEMSHLMMLTNPVAISPPVVAGHQNEDKLQNPVLRREGALDDTRLIDTPLTAELVVMKGEHCQTRQFTQALRN